jgi:RND family efflux transporter MFP subunit
MADSQGRLADLRIERRDDDEGSPWVRRIALLIAAVALVAVAWWWFFLRQPAVTVAVASVTRSEAGQAAVSVLDASGYVTARREATVSAKLTGKIDAVLVEEGMAVRRGQILARLDDATARRQLELAEANRDSAVSSLKEIEVRRDEAALELRRQRDLAAESVASQRDLDSAQAAFDSLVARLAVARDQVAVAEREVALNRQQIEDHLVRAPFDGIAISKDAQPGEMISPISAGGGFTRTGISTIVDMSSLEIEVDVNEAYINRVEPNQRVVATLDAYPEWKIPAHVITIIPAADRQKATVRVRIGFDELGDPRILPDMGVKVSFRGDEPAPSSETTQPSRVLLVPEASVRSEGGREYVFVLSGETVERRAVSLGGSAEARREVVAGLRDGERVVIDPPAGLADGSRVRLEENR